MGEKAVKRNAHSPTSGVWFYFPVVFMLKTQLVALALGFLGAVYALRHPRRWQPASVLLGFTAGIFLITVLFSKINLGIRHISLILPLFSIFIACAYDQLSRQLPRRWLAPAVAGLYILPLFTFPPTAWIGYTNVLVSPKQNAYRYFNDSNLDWGQQSKAIAETVKFRYSEQPIYSNYLWNPYALGYYGVRQLPYDPNNPPREGVIMLTATERAAAEVEGRAPFRTVQPDFHIGNHTFFYRAESFSNR